VEFLESSPQVAGYAWFKERVEKNPKISLLDKEPGKLTAVGAEYVKVPSHSMHVFYRIPGLLDSGKYVANDKMTLEDTTDAGGDFDMVSHSAAWVDYNIQVDVPGTYLLRMRVSGAPGRVEVLQDGVVLGSVDTIEKAWHTEETAVPLAAGAQTIRVRFSGGQSLHSIDFSVKPGIAMTK
ncbi:MAG TPA: carbohydrate-binding protein, partial [Chthoniobacteraceae bacterium]|nr:carbohydrate-binding protein [Chthoniobacteraceae bacterium]